MNAAGELACGNVITYGDPHPTHGKSESGTLALLLSSPPFRRALLQHRRPPHQPSATPSAAATSLRRPARPRALAMAASPSASSASRAGERPIVSGRRALRRSPRSRGRSWRLAGPWWSGCGRDHPRGTSRVGLIVKSCARNRGGHPIRFRRRWKGVAFDAWRKATSSVTAPTMWCASGVGRRGSRDYKRSHSPTPESE